MTYRGKERSEGRCLIGSISGAMLIALFAPPGGIKRTGECCQCNDAQITQREGLLSSPPLTVMMVGFSIHFPILRNSIGCDCFHKFKKDQCVLLSLITSLCY